MRIDDLENHMVIDDTLILDNIQNDYDEEAEKSYNHYILYAECDDGEIIEVDESTDENEIKHWIEEGLSEDEKSAGVIRQFYVKL